MIIHWIPPKMPKRILWNRNGETKMSRMKTPNQRAAKKKAQRTLVGCERKVGVDRGRTEEMYKAIWCGAVRKNVIMLTRHTTEMLIPKTKVNVLKTKEMKYTRYGLCFTGLPAVLCSSDPCAALDWFSATNVSLVSARQISRIHLIATKRRTIHSIPDQIVATTTPGAFVPSQNRMLMKNMTAQSGTRRKP